MLKIFIIFCTSLLAISLQNNTYATTFADSKYTNNITQTFRLQSNDNIIMLEIYGYQQTEDYTCASASMMNLLNYYNILSDSQMNRTVEMKMSDKLGTNNDYGTTAEQMVDWFKKHNIKATIHTNGTVDDLLSNLNNGIPTLVNWIDWGGHWALMSGYQKLSDSINDDKDTIFFTDPAAHFNNSPSIYGLTAINPDRFQTMWFDSKNVKGIYITVEQPESHNISI